MLRLATVCGSIGLALVLWYSGWGVHGCDDSGACSARMDRDYTVWLVGLAALAVGLVLAVVASLDGDAAARRQSRDASPAPTGEAGSSRGGPPVGG